MKDDPPNPLLSTEDAPKSAPTAPSNRPGQVVSHYRLGELLGEGGMGVVYRAEDLTLHRPVAIKFMQRSGDVGRARFLREARAASALDHPNIGTVYEIGESDGAPFIVMALYEGETLRQRIQRAPLGVDEVVAIAAQLCRALSAAHHAGIVHRDLKPANVMLLADGTVKLLDFGLAKLTSTAMDESSLTRDGAILGTLAYMAPEQLRSATIDARTDLWALGAVLHEMLSGRPPFDHAPAATVVTRILTEAPPPLEAPEDLRLLSARLLSKDPARRLDSASAVQDLLSRRSPPRDSTRGGLAIGGAVVLAAGLFGLVAALRPAAQPAVAVDLAPEEIQDAGGVIGAQALAAAEGIYERATRHFQLGRYDEAAAGFQAMFELTGESTVLFNIGQAHRMAKNPQRALFFFKEYLRANPDALNAAEVKVKIAELSHALPAAAARGDANAGDRTRQGELAFSRGDFAAAVADFEAAYESGGDAELLLKLGQSHLGLGNKQKARLFLENYVRQGGKNAEAERALATLASKKE